ncbi:MAG: FAD-dependent oxidoreductase [Planctomycetota bacterium]|nr:FAD-dependent oxidoreductase [Planctomycetota bacterium]
MRWLVWVVVLAVTAAEMRAATVDVVVYGGTASGIVAAVQARRMGKSVVVIEPTGRIGGLTTGGLGQTDIGNKSVIGGLAREFYRGIRQHYESPSAWKWQRRDEYRSGGQSRTGATEDVMWTFEPSAALTVLERMAADAGVEIVYRERLDRMTGVRKQGAQVESIVMESGRAFLGRMFIDATYEGDLMAAAGVPFHVGRESGAHYEESLNGVQTAQAKHHQFAPGVDPYVRPGDSSSGLLPFIDPTGPGAEALGDHRVQAYCFRMCLTDHPENRIPFIKPSGYDELWYELLLRNFEAGEATVPWLPGPMPNRKTDTNNNRGFSTDFIGQNYAYPEATYAERERIVAHHRLYQQGLMWTLANHPRVPEAVRKEVSRWGMCRDEFVEGNGWQEQLYVREARRMIGDYVMTQHDCQGRRVAPRPVGMAAYNMDSHNVQRHVDVDGKVRNEGDVQVRVDPYPIDYGAIVPQAAHATNLLVPVALSASHIAYGSIRMEPVFMVLGQSAATAAAIAIDDGRSIQQIEYQQLQARLLADGQLLEWTGPRSPVGLDPRELPGIVIDDGAATFTGAWQSSSAIAPFVADGYRHDADTSKGECSARYGARVPKAGRYEIRMIASPGPNRATNVPVTLEIGTHRHPLMVNQRSGPTQEGWHSLGQFDLAEGNAVVVVISNADTDGHVIVDAVHIVPVAAE